MSRRGEEYRCDACGGAVHFEAVVHVREGHACPVCVTRLLSGPWNRDFVFHDVRVQEGEHVVGAIVTRQDYPRGPFRWPGSEAEMERAREELHQARRDVREAAGRYGYPPPKDEEP